MRHERKRVKVGSTILKGAVPSRPLSGSGHTDTDVLGKIIALCSDPQTGKNAALAELIRYTLQTGDFQPLTDRWLRHWLPGTTLALTKTRRVELARQAYAANKKNIPVQRCPYKGDSLTYWFAAHQLVSIADHAVNELFFD